MRIVINGADFSQVSIGKVEEGHQFDITLDNIKEFFVNVSGSKGSYTTSAVQYYNIDNGQWTTITNQYRAKSDFIEVNENMKINFGYFQSSVNVPTLICFDENQDIMSVSAAYNQPYATDTTFIVPTGCKYIVLQCDTGSINNASFGVHGRD